MTDQLFIMEGNGQVKIYNGNYSSYRLELEENKQQAKKPAPEPVKAVEAVKKSKLSYKEEKELQTIEQEIASLEAKLKAVNDKLNTTGLNNAEFIDLSKEAEKISNELDLKSFRWMELTELKEA